MKKVYLFVFLFASFFNHAQISFQFSDPQPAQKPELVSTDKSMYGKYKSSTGSTTYVINETGIAIESIIVNSITREQVRESSEISLKGAYLHGLNGFDSLPCVEDGDLLFYGIVRSVLITGAGQTNVLTRLSSTEYILNFHEGQYFEPSILKFVNGNLEIIHGDMSFTNELDKILQVNTTIRYGEQVKVLSPTLEQWPELKKILFEGKTIIYKRVFES